MMDVDQTVGIHIKGDGASDLGTVGPWNGTFQHSQVSFKSNHDCAAIRAKRLPGEKPRVGST